MNVPVLAEDGAKAGEVTLLDEIFAAKIRAALVHQVVTAQLAASRSGAHHTRTRAEVRGGGRKPWRQKGTGRARHGSIREPQWVGGGIAHGPKPRDHSKGVPKKMKALALRSVLSARAAEGKVHVVEDLTFDVPKTKRAAKALKAWGAEGNVLLVLSDGQEEVAHAFRNLPEVHCISQNQLNTYDVVRADAVVFLRSALDAFQERAASLPSANRGDGRAATPTETPAQTAQTAEERTEEGALAGFPGPTPSETETPEEGDGA